MGFTYEIVVIESLPLRLPKTDDVYLLSDQAGPTMVLPLMHMFYPCRTPILSAYLYVQAQVWGRCGLKWAMPRRPLHFQWDPPSGFHSLYIYWAF